MPNHSKSASWLPRSFRFTYSYDEHRDSPLKDVLTRQQLCNKPVDLFWLLNAPLRNAIVVNAVELDSSQDLLLLLQYDQPHHSGGHAKSINIYPIQLSNPVGSSSRGKANTHQQANKGLITVGFEHDDVPEGNPGDELEIEMTLCGDLFALFVRYVENQRVVICNWKTGSKVAMLDCNMEHTNGLFPGAVPHPLNVTRFAWLAPNAFAIISEESNMPNNKSTDALYIYGLSGNSEQPLSHSVALELPRWPSDFDRRYSSDAIELKFVTGSWSEDIYPGALSDNATNRVTVLTEKFPGGRGLDLRYTLRNDILVNHYLAQRSGSVLRWSDWSGKSSVGVFRNSPLVGIQVYGWTVLSTVLDPRRGVNGVTEVQIADFDPAGTHGHDWSASSRAGDMKIVNSPSYLERGCSMPLKAVCTTSSLVYRSMPMGRMDPATKYILGAGRLFLTQDNWHNVQCMPLARTA